MGYDWDLWIWAPLSCALPDFEDADDQEFVMTYVEKFPFREPTEYEVGYNIFVKLNN